AFLGSRSGCGAVRHAGNRAATNRAPEVGAVTVPYQRSGVRARGRRRIFVGCRPNERNELRKVAMPRFSRQKLHSKFAEMVRRREPIIGGGAGTGLSAKCEEAGGVDLMVIYNSGRYRMAGRSSLSGLLAFGNANEIVLEMAREVLPVVKHTPVLAGVNGTDPFLLLDPFLRQFGDL